MISGCSKMNQRATDTNAGPVKIVREIPLWGIVMLAMALLGQALLMWRGQSEQALRLETMTEKLTEFTSELKALNTRAGANEVRNAERDAQLKDHERRLLLLEAQEMRGPRR
jgi:hypothetical protein